MSVQNFIPTVWSETLKKALNEKYVGVANCSREYEGDIRQKGNRVKILNVGAISVSDYTPNTNMSDPETLDGGATDLVIDRAKYFNFQLDDVDHAQAVPGLMDAAMKTPQPRWQKRRISISARSMTRWKPAFLATPSTAYPPTF